MHSATNGGASDQDSESSDEQKWMEREDVPDALRQQWESEQELMKKSLFLGDTSEVKQLYDMYKSNLAFSAPVKQFYIGGVDVSFVKGDNVNACAALVVTEFPSLELVYEDCELIQLTLPYIPGFLGFREVPHIVRLFEKLHDSNPQYLPKIVMVDGNGILHPRGFGSACHLGFALDVACIGVAKTLFHVDGLEKNKQHQDKIAALQAGGDTFPLVGASGNILGKALRSCSTTTNPVYVSVGHKISLDTAVWLVHRCCKFRIPEPVRWADLKSREFLQVNFKPPHSEEKDKHTEPETDEEVPWQFLEHSGPQFPPPYNRLPQNVKFLYNRKPMTLSVAAEEAVVNYVKMLDSDDCIPSRFKDNFLKTWREEMTPTEREVIKDLENCDFSEITRYLKKQSDQRKHMTQDERKALRKQNEALTALHGFCIVDGKTQRVVNFRITPPGIFHGRGDHPRAGYVKKRLRPEDVVINCSRNSKFPVPLPGHQWKTVRHDNTVSWLACWEDEVLAKTIYMCPLSSKHAKMT